MGCNGIGRYKDCAVKDLTVIMGEFAEEVRSLIEAGELEGAIDKVLDCLAGKNTGLYNEATLQKAALNQNNRSIRQAIVSNDEANRVRARINLAVLSLLVEIEKEGVRCGGEKGNTVIPAKSGIDLETAREKVKILFLGANPRNTTRVRIDEELSAIENSLRLSKERERLALSARWAVTPSALLQAVLDESPGLIHFSGHGNDKGIILENADGNDQLVTEQALENLFCLFSDTVQCIVLNACYSEMQARALAKHIQYIVGMNSAITDQTAIAFSVGFYKALGAGKDIEFAYKLGISSIRLEGLKGEEIPQLLRSR